MDDKYKDYLTYLEFLHRIGRRVGYKSEAESESMKMTREEQIKLSGLMIKNQSFPRTFPDTIYITEILEMMLDNNEKNQFELIQKIQEAWIDHSYLEIESLLKQITGAELHD